MIDLTYIPELRRRGRRQREMRRPRRQRVVGDIGIDRLPPSLRKVVEHITESPGSDSYASKPYGNRQGALPGDGPFREYVARGNKGRVVVDEATGCMYVTRDHHGTYSLLG